MKLLYKRFIVDAKEYKEYKDYLNGISEFVSDIGPDRLVAINGSNMEATIVWYWEEEPEYDNRYPSYCDTF